MTLIIELVFGYEPRPVSK